MQRQFFSMGEVLMNLKKSNITNLEQLERTCRRHQMLDVEEDRLTGLYNRKYLLDKLETAGELATRHNHPLALVVVAIDHFAAIQAQFSEQIGDRVLIKVAKLLKASLRSNDIISRYGENQFALVFAKAHALDIQALCERLRIKIATIDWSKTALGLKVTASFGSSDIQECGTGAAMLEKALAILEEASQEQAG
jgi:diguanylate cyclase (GGDEF)-like protein